MHKECAWAEKLVRSEVNAVRTPSPVDLLGLLWTCLGEGTILKVSLEEETIGVTALLHQQVLNI